MPPNDNSSDIPAAIPATSDRNPSTIGVDAGLFASVFSGTKLAT
jgi:hypothetical protein